ncbi:MAG: ATP-binding protein [Desulfobacter sp.]
MARLALRWKLIIFFCLLGLLPLVFISYYSLAAHTKSLEEAYASQVNQIVGQAATRISRDYTRIAGDLTDHAIQPYLQLSFQQFPQSTRRLLLRERLELFRSSTNRFSRLSLCYPNGGRLVTTPAREAPDRYATFEETAVPQMAPDNTGPRLFSDTRELALFIPVFSFRDPDKLAGFMVAYLPVSRLTATLAQIDIGFDTEKIIRTRSGDTVSAFSPESPFAPSSGIRRYISKIPSLDWTLEVNVREKDLFADVAALRQKNVLFIGATLVCALAVTFLFSKRFTTPFDTIIRGTQTYARGDLTHRIRVTGGYEAGKLAQAFNTMARELDERQAELDRAIRLASIGVMTAGLGHEIKNPLTGIKTSAQVISKVVSGPPFKAAYTGSPDGLSNLVELSGNISAEADRVTRILNDLLKLGKPGEPNRTYFDLSQIVHKALGLLGPRFDKKGIQRDAQVPCLGVRADPDQILQVLINLLLNARDAVPNHGGRIKIRGNTLPSGHQVLKICDNGPGIAGDKIQHIFDPFFSLKKEGTGLGLSVVYSLLKQNGVQIQADSPAGQGMAFTLTFPGPDRAGGTT